MKSITDQPLSTKLTLSFSGVIVVTLIVGAVTFNRLSVVEQSAAWNYHTHEVLEAVGETVQDIVEQESAQRSYLITGTQGSLAGYQPSRDAFTRDLAHVRQLTADNAAQQARLDQLSKAANDWQLAADNLIALRSKPDTMDQVLTIVSGGSLKANMDKVRAIAADVRQVEAQLLAVRSQTQADALWTTRAIAIAGVLMTAVIAFFACWMLRRMVGAPIVALNGAMRRLAEGDHDVTVPATDRADEIGGMAGAVQVFKDAAIEKQRLTASAAEQASMIERDRAAREKEASGASAALSFVVTSLGDGLSHLSQGDLTYRLDKVFVSEYEKLRADFNAAATKLDESLSGVVTNISGMQFSTNEIAQASDDLSRRTEQQAASLEQTAAAMGQITSTMSKTAEGASHARDVVVSTKSDAELSGEVVRQAVSAMGEIESSSQQISQIIGVIDEIAFQTNLLALNAGVEAARAGDSGRGFAVVASEVRALAQRSADAAREIKSLISASTTRVTLGVKLVDQTGDALARIVERFNEINTAVADIAKSAREQSASLSEVNVALDQMDKVTQQNAAMVEESTAACHTLAREADNLVTLTNRFQVSNKSDTSRSHRAPAAPARPATVTPRPASSGLKLVAGANRKPVAVGGDGDWDEF